MLVVRGMIFGSGTRTPRLHVTEYTLLPSRLRFRYFCYVGTIAGMRDKCIDDGSFVGSSVWYAVYLVPGAC